MFGKFRNSIVGKIIAGYALVVCLAFVTTLVSMYTAYKNRKIDKLVSEAYYPMILSLKETEILLSDSYKLTNNWIYQPNVKEKERLKLIHSVEVAAQRENILAIADRFDSDSAKLKTEKMMASIDLVVEEEKTVMQKLAKDESYSDDVAVDEAITAMDQKITSAFNKSTKQINELLKQQNQLLDEAKADKEASSAMLSALYVGNLILFVIIGIYATYISMNSVTKPISALSDLILMLSKGKFVSVTMKKSKDEIGRMAEAIENMLNGLRKKIEFAESIGKGNYDSRFELLSEEDAMGQALMQMRDNLSQAASEDRKRNWATEGLAKFADILRSKNDSLADLSDSIISNLVKYMNANQGALYLINDDNKSDTYLEMIACYAYNRKKYLNSRVDIGQGIVGQCVLEKGTIYMTDIPKDYVRITSGLGEALPRNLLIVPLKLDETVFGVVELASFEGIESYKTDFVEKLGESIASTISSVKVSERTKKLLNETQVQAEQMRAQEEEMRQNMEELSATQEDMQRVLNEAQGKERYMNDLINSSSDSILTVDRDYGVVNFNDTFASTYISQGIKIEKGFDLRGIFSGDEWLKFKNHYDRVFRGETFEITESYQSHGFDSYFLISYSPLRNNKGEVIGAAVFAKDTTQIKQKETYLNNIINAYNDAILTVDLNRKIVMFNDYLAKTYAAQGIQITQGMEVFLLSPPEKRAHSEENYLKAFAGETITEKQIYFDRHYEITTKPLTNTEGRIVGATVFTKEITEHIKLVNESQQRLEEVRAQEEELRQNMEEMQAIQEDTEKVRETAAIKFQNAEKEYKLRIEMLEKILSEKGKPFVAQNSSN